MLTYMYLLMCPGLRVRRGGAAPTISPAPQAEAAEPFRVWLRALFLT